MENYKLVLPENLNQYGFLFGGYMLKFVDEIAWIAATLDYPGFNFVTIAMDQVEFRRSIRGGTILKFICQKTRTGNTSVSYLVEVYNANSPTADPESMFSTTVTMVRVDENGRKKLLDAQ
jgi:acyl-CoA hydrolase